MSPMLQPLQRTRVEPGKKVAARSGLDRRERPPSVRAARGPALHNYLASTLSPTGHILIF